MGILYVQQIELEIDLLRAEVKYKGEIIRMSSTTEYSVLVLLACDPYAMRTITLIREHARLLNDGEVFTLISRLRKKFNGEIIISYTRTRDRETSYSLIENNVLFTECPKCRTNLDNDRFCPRCRVYRLGN